MSNLMTSTQKKSNEGSEQKQISKNSVQSAKNNGSTNNFVFQQPIG